MDSQISIIEGMIPFNKGNVQYRLQFALQLQIIQLNNWTSETINLYKQKFESLHLPRDFTLNCLSIESIWNLIHRVQTGEVLPSKNLPIKHQHDACPWVVLPSNCCLSPGKTLQSTIKSNWAQSFIHATLVYQSNLESYPAAQILVQEGVGRVEHSSTSSTTTFSANCLELIEIMRSAQRINRV